MKRDMSCVLRYYKEDVKSLLNDQNSFFLIFISDKMAAGGQVGGYEFKVKGKLPTTCQCLICQELIRECTELPCHHPYCKSCLLRWEEQKREENERLRRYKN